jgi:hypothetical protein
MHGRAARGACDQPPLRGTGTGNRTGNGLKPFPTNARCGIRLRIPRNAPVSPYREKSFSLFFQLEYRSSRSKTEALVKRKHRLVTSCYRHSNPRTLPRTQPTNAILNEPLPDPVLSKAFIHEKALDLADRSDDSCETIPDCIAIIRTRYHDPEIGFVELHQLLNALPERKIREVLLPVNGIATMQLVQLLPERFDDRYFLFGDNTNLVFHGRMILWSGNRCNNFRIPERKFKAL